MESWTAATMAALSPREKEKRWKTPLLRGGKAANTHTTAPQESGAAADLPRLTPAPAYGRLCVCLSAAANTASVALPKGVYCEGIWLTFT